VRAANPLAAGGRLTIFPRGHQLAVTAARHLIVCRMGRWLSNCATRHRPKWTVHHGALSRSPSGGRIAPHRCCEWGRYPVPLHRRGRGVRQAPLRRGPDRPWHTPRSWRPRLLRLRERSPRFDRPSGSARRRSDHLASKLVRNPLEVVAIEQVPGAVGSLESASVNPSPYVLVTPALRPSRSLFAARSAAGRLVSDTLDRQRDRSRDRSWVRGRDSEVSLIRVARPFPVVNGVVWGLGIPTVTALPRR